MSAPRLPAAIVSRDGKRSVALTEITGTKPKMMGVGVGFRLELEPGAEDVYGTVPVPDWAFSGYNPERLGLGKDEEANLLEMVVLGLGIALDEGPLAVEEEFGSSLVKARANFAVIEARARKHGGDPNTRASDDEAFAYVGAKLYHAWRFGYPEAEFTVADEIRLGVRFGDLNRVAIAGEGTYWTRTSDPPGMGRPRWTAARRLILDLPAGRFPGLEQSPIFAVSERLTAPRYEAVAEAWRKAVDFVVGDGADPANGAKEAVAAVESLVKIIEESPNATLGDAVKGLRTSGKIRPPLDKVFHKLWGFSSNAGGIRHAGVEVPDTTPSEAEFILNMAASAVLYLLQLDRAGPNASG